MKKLIVFISSLILVSSVFSQEVVFSAQDTIDAQKMSFDLINAIWSGNLNDALKNIDPTDTEMLNDITESVDGISKMLTEARIQGLEIKFKVRDAKVRKITKSDMKSLRKMDKLPEDAVLDAYLKVGVMVNVDVKYQGEAQSETQNMIIYVTRKAEQLYIRHVDSGSM
jgi:hypothetical protein